MCWVTILTSLPMPTMNRIPSIPGYARSFAGFKKPVGEAW